MKGSVRGWGSIVLACAAILLPGAAMAQAFPSRTVSILVGNPPGGPTDAVARLLADKLQQKFRQTVIVENKPGANTVLAMNQLMASPADGYKVMVMASGVTYQSVIDKNINIDFVNDIAHVGIIMTGDYVYYAPEGSPFSTMEELVAWLKANPGKANYANASGDLVSISLFKAMTETQFEVVRYNGATRALHAILSKEATFSGGVPVSTVKALHESGKVRLLAMAGQNRAPLVPDLPSLGESKLDALRTMSQYGGFAGYWLGIVAPKGTQGPVVATWNAALSEVLSEPDVRDKVQALGMTPRVTSADDMMRRIATDVPRWSQVARDNGLQKE